MAEDHGTPRADQIDVAVAVDIGEPAAMRLRDEARRAAHRGEGPYRGVHPAGDDCAGLLEQLGRGAHSVARLGGGLVSAAHDDQCSSRRRTFNYRV